LAILVSTNSYEGRIIFIKTPIELLIFYPWLLMNVLNNFDIDVHFFTSYINKIILYNFVDIK